MWASYVRYVFKGSATQIYLKIIKEIRYSRNNRETIFFRREKDNGPGKKYTKGKWEKKEKYGKKGEMKKVKGLRR